MVSAAVRRFDFVGGWLLKSRQTEILIGRYCYGPKVYAFSHAAIADSG
jgi:hypothetical protein